MIFALLRDSRLIAAALFIVLLSLYLLTLTRVHTFDALSYVMSVERKPWTELFHPHHLAYGPLGALMLTLSRALGYDGGAALPMQLVNAIAGALGAAVFYLTARTTTGRDDAALLAGLLLGMAYAWWYYAVEIEVYTVAALFLIACLALMTRQTPWTRRRCLTLGIAQGGAVLFHQTNVLLCAPIAVSALTDLRSAWNTNGRHAAAGRWTGYATALAIVVALPYLYVMLLVNNFRTPEEMLAWLTEYARTGWWGGPLTHNTLVGLGVGVSDALAQPGGGWFYLALGGIGAWVWGKRQRPVIIAQGNGQKPTSARRVALAPLIAWLATYGAFFAWWEPDNIEFWIASLPPACLLFATTLARARPWSAPVWASLAIIGVLAWVNYDAITRRGDPANDLQRVIARELAALSAPADLFIVPDGLQELYLPYYERRENVVSLNQALFESGGLWESACAAIRNRIAIAQRAGAAVIIADEALRPPVRLLHRHGITQSQVDACLAPYRETLTDLAFVEPLPPYWRLPSATEMALQGRWTFRRDTMGWQAFNVANERLNDGWRFQPGVDPALVSPLLNLDARRVTAIEIRMANDTRARDAQLFYAGPDGALTEQYSVRWELADTAEAVTYTIDLRKAPGWNGIITRLRIDPVGVGDGGEIRVEWVRLRQ
ncbi:MAG: glycosyltransferase family 39 protein [Roseiflexus sp.]|nr:glycosyltransferase family 39 protein [Roseiflexus sp.]MCS7288984.1 glycosyltransferase family 39 protein [Roseiflexus sp.]MDW8147100.1 glycosyltransferase family 39 protein [Roseiflexaceae bacterium]MDW8231710.1 glycosyltransferase family 39 protein [Roseiflexaceae bacterium]